MERGLQWPMTLSGLSQCVDLVWGRPSATCHVYTVYIYIYEWGCVRVCVITSISQPQSKASWALETSVSSLCVLSPVASPKAECVFVCVQVRVSKTSSDSVYIRVLPSMPVQSSPRAVTSHSIYSPFTLYSQQSWFYGGPHAPARGRHQLDLSGIRLPLQSPFHDHPVYKHYWFSHCAFCTCV